MLFRLMDHSALLPRVSAVVRGKQLRQTGLGYLLSPEKLTRSTRTTRNAHWKKSTDNVADCVLGVALTTPNRQDNNNTPRVQRVRRVPRCCFSRPLLSADTTNMQYITTSFPRSSACSASSAVSGLALRADTRPPGVRRSRSRCQVPTVLRMKAVMKPNGAPIHHPTAPPTVPRPARRFLSYSRPPGLVWARIRGTAISGCGSLYSLRRMT